MEKMLIQRATGHELRDLVPLFAAYLAFYGKPVDEARISAFLGERLKRNESVVFLAFRGEAAVGFVQLYPAFASLSLAPSWILNDLFVSPGARGAGIAEALLVAARDLARDTGAAELFLQTAHDNLPAQRLYERLGWRRDEQFRVYTLDPRQA